MKKILFLLYVLTISAGLTAQRNCGTMDYYNQQLSADPTLDQRRQEIETFTENFIANGGMQSGNRAIVTIPVVVHVVYNTAAQNVSDAQIQSQIDVLNADFHKLNTDWTSTPTVFQGLVADCEIQFCLAQRDPNGNATNGIVRVSTATTSFSQNNNVKFTASGGDDAWPSSSYLNIWVCPLSGGLLGYAQFPGGSASTDGVVITYTGFGNTGTAAAPFDLGRTATHEVGHWLNLYHIWGDDGTACTGSDNCADTPNQADENYGCPAFPNVSCSNGPNGDMFMNYMDYTNDACMFMFTAGQKARMQALFATGGSRVSLLSSLGCQPPVASNCAAVTGLSASAITQNSASISWTGVSGNPHYDVFYKPSASVNWLSVSTNNTSITLTNLNSGTIYNYKVETRCRNGSRNSTLTLSFTTTGSSGCTDAYESNGTLATAKAIPLSTIIKGLISSSTDNDYFKFANNASQPNVAVILTGLPADYNIRLYNSAGTQVASSLNTGTADESIVYNNAAVDSYYVRVSGNSGAFNTGTCYTLVAAISRNAFRYNNTLQDFLTPDAPILELFPNPTTGSVNVNMDLGEAESTVTVSVFDYTGREIRAYRYENVSGLMQSTLNLQDVPNGLYHVLVNSQLGSISRKLVLAK
ncbi:MAG: T9SS type A sorting domain-containing protein [Chitinophagales bacterium]